MAHITKAQLIAHAISLNAALTEETAAELIKNAGAKSYKKVGEAVEAAREEAKPKKTRAPKGEVKLVEPGPRGFSFGATYIQSVIEAGPIALKPANKLKLVGFAEMLGVAGITIKSDATEAVKMLKAAAKKYFTENFEVQA